MFAYIRKTNSHKLDKFGQIHFTSLQFIEVVGINRCVAFFNIGQNSNYILIEKEFNINIFIYKKNKIKNYVKRN